MNTQNNYVFIITSTINTNLGLINPQDRFTQTLETIESIKTKVENYTIIMVDNSTNFLQEKEYNELIKKVDFFINVGQRKFCKFLNDCGIKGAGEAYMLLVGLDAIKVLNLKPSRIFKISGRYKLRDFFDLKQYENTYGKYCFKTRSKNEYDKFFLHSRMWSACGSLLNEMHDFIGKSCEEHLFKNITIEEALYNNIDLTKLLEFDRIECEGYIAPWNKLILD